MITLFAPVGISADHVLSPSTIERITSYIFPTILGILATVYYSKRLSKSNNNINCNNGDNIDF